MTGPLRVDDRDVGKAGDKSHRHNQIVSSRQVNNDSVPTGVGSYSRHTHHATRHKIMNELVGQQAATTIRKAKPSLQVTLPTVDNRQIISSEPEHIMLQSRHPRPSILLGKTRHAAGMMTSCSASSQTVPIKNYPPE